MSKRTVGPPAVRFSESSGSGAVRGHGIPEESVDLHTDRDRPWDVSEPEVASADGRGADCTSDARLPVPLWLRWGMPPYLVLVDLAAFALATSLTAPAYPVHLLVLVVNLLAFRLAGLYRSRLTLRLINDLPYIAGAVLVGVTMKVAVYSVLSGVDPPPRQLVHALVLLGTVVVFRTIAYTVVRYARRSGLVRHRTVVLGAGDLGLRILATMFEHREHGLEPVGVVDTRGAKDSVEPLQVPLLGSYDQLAAIIREHAIRDVIVAFGGVNDQHLVDILRVCDRLECEVFLVPRLFELHNSNRDTDEIYGIPLIRRRRAAFRTPLWRVKRGFDVLLSALALVALAPFMAVCALAVRWEGGPGMLFRQERVGADGHRFEVLKFRSLKPADETESQTQWNVKHDSRLGPVGKFLRRSSLDELPQLWNILVGDMSIVGPRPERPHFVKQFSEHIPRYTARSRVPAGLTGWAQVHGLRGDTSIEDRARFDNYYIENWTLWLDVKIIIKTVVQVVRRQGG